MRRTLLVVVLLAGCGADGATVIDAGLPDLTALDLTVPVICHDNEIGDAGLPPTLTNVQKVFDNACIGCHCCDDPLTLTDGRSFMQLVNRPAPNTSRNTDETCGGVLVTPGDPSKSYLYQKISTTMPCAGQPMPLQEFQFIPLPMCEIDLVRRWIQAGAPNN